MSSENTSIKETVPSYSSYYMLDRDYFSECFDQSAQPQTGFNAYRKAMLLLGIAACLFVIGIEAYAAWFILALAVLEVFSIRYRRAWWIARQMLSRASGSKVNLYVDAVGISSESTHHKQCIEWADISELLETSKGFVISHSNGRNYVSKSILDDDALGFIRQQAGAAAEAE